MRRKEKKMEEKKKENTKEDTKELLVLDGRINDKMHSIFIDDLRVSGSKWNDVEGGIQFKYLIDAEELLTIMQRTKVFKEYMDKVIKACVVGVTNEITGIATKGTKEFGEVTYTATGLEIGKVLREKFGTKW